MKNIMIYLAFGMMVMGLSYAWPMINEISKQQQIIVRLEHDMVTKNKELNQLSGLRSLVLADITEYHHEVFYALYRFLEQHRFKGNIEVISIDQAKWEGIREIKFKINVLNINDMIQSLRIINQLQYLEQSYPIVFNSLNFSGSTFQAQGGIYGI